MSKSQSINKTLVPINQYINEGEAWSKEDQQRHGENTSLDQTKYESDKSRPPLEDRQQHHGDAFQDKNKKVSDKFEAPSEDGQQTPDENKSLDKANSADEYARIFNKLNGYLPGFFEFKGAYYWSEEKRYGYDYKIDISKVSNFILDVEYSLKDDSNPEKPIHHYHLKIKPKEGAPRFIIASAKEIAKPSDFTKSLLQKAKVSWMGRWPALGALHRKITQANVPTVRVLPSIGYDSQTNCYVFKDFMVNLKGELIKPDQRGFYKLSDKDYLRPPFFVDHENDLDN